MKGLTSRFGVKNGKLVLTSGIDKSRDSIWFYCIFDRFRIYTSDYGYNFNALIQRPASSIVLNQTLITSQIRQGIEKYVPNVTVNSVDIGTVPPDRKTYHLLIEYASVEERNIVSTDVIFV